MADKTIPKTVTGRKKGKKIILWISASVVVLIFLILLLIPVYISSDTGRRTILNRINGAITGKASIGDISMGWWKGVFIRDFHIDDAFDGTSYSFDAAGISAKPYYGSILSGTLSLGKAIIDRPKVIINIKQQPSQQHQKQTQGVASEKNAQMALGMIDMKVNQGNAVINLESQDKSVKTLHLKDIQTTLALEPPGKTSTFDVSMAVGDTKMTSTVAVKGSLKPSSEKSWTLKGTSGDFSVKIDDLDIGSLSPLLALAGQDIQPQGKLNADIEVNIDDGSFRKLKADAVLSDLKQMVSGKEVGIGQAVKIAADMSSEDKVLKINKLNIESSFCRLNCTGQADKINYDLTADLKQTQDFAAQFTDFAGNRIAGKLTSAGKISMDKNIVSAAGQGAISGLIISTPQASAPPTDVKIDFDTRIDNEKQIVNIQAVKVAALPGNIQIMDSKIPLAENNKDQLSVGIAANIDLAKALPYAVAFKFIPKEMQLSGLVESKITVNAEKNSYRIKTDSTTIKKLHLVSPGQKPLDQEQVTLVADALINPDEKAVAIQNVQLISPNIKIQKGSFSSSATKGVAKLEGHFDCEYDWAAVGAVTSPYMPQGLKIEGQRKDTISFKTEYPEKDPGKLLANLNADAKLGFEKAEYKGLNLGKTEIPVKVKNGMLNIVPFTTAVNEGKLNFAGNINFRETPAMFRTPGPIQIIENLNVNQQVSQSLLMYLNPIFKDQADIAGVANFYAEKMSIPLGAASANAAEVIGTVSIEKMKLQTLGLLGTILTYANSRPYLDAALLPTKFVFQNGRVSYDDMQINVDTYPMNFKGSIGPNNKLEMNVVTPYVFGSDMKLKTVKADQAATEERLSLPLSGTIDKPNINMAKLVEQQAPKILWNILEEQLKKKDSKK
ncbi:MAG: hypothetical protein E4H40_02355 [Candidatus Brocadiia bacterium]|nr:MAG: hypothetical protein E4H40_02355 [Candidatus Brocadiia bacterium]